ncbi:hypothetical protein [Okeania sp. SIO3B5]|nr:hypothetical protein [Okeania sp. SIO3B5]
MSKIRRPPLIKIVIAKLPNLNPQLSLHEAPKKGWISHCTSKKMMIV